MRVRQPLALQARWGGDGMSAFATTDSRPARHVPANPRPLCRDFTPNSEPSAFWCGTCRWNEVLHDDEAARTAIAAELDRLGAEAVSAS